MRPEELSALAYEKKSLLCVALDPSEEAFHQSQLTVEAAEERLYQVIEATASYAIAYKLNTAFYERWGEKGWGLLRRIRAALPSPALTIADAKRGDIAHTSQYYARGIFEELGFDAITVHPYMGWVGLEPFLQYEGKWVFVLLRTTEAPAWQKEVWRTILEEIPSHIKATLGWVWGAHYGKEITELREKRPRDWLLVPGVGAQGGKLEGGAPLFPSLIVVGRAILQKPEEAKAWAAASAAFLPQAEATGRFELP
ncbi:MAG: orotidine-5'-phosphate decarboxylase [Bacteroidia bacterium]|nr:orotidine-5'-phosphate decarboxylase [Bacteroidia bacterium]MCX7764635.1 orotidine-5'-phosphate decarboxylase [Bacteroidia bacterium]MDW8056754.1 orotidine-5'-phosphate decarboxylase [Bacteroidia bacterium]